MFAVNLPRRWCLQGTVWMVSCQFKKQEWGPVLPRNEESVRHSPRVTERERHATFACTMQITFLRAFILQSSITVLCVLIRPPPVHLLTYPFLPNQIYLISTTTFKLLLQHSTQLNTASETG